MHRLVAEHFIVNVCPNSFTVVNHKNFNRKDNNSDNLEWTDTKGNIHHTINNNRANYCKGENKPTCKITEKDVLRIRERISNGETRRNIAKDYPISDKQVGSIGLRKKWAHI